MSGVASDQQQGESAAGGGAAPCVLAVQLSGPRGLVDFVEPSDGASLLAATPAQPAPPAAAPVVGAAARRASGPLPIGMGVAGGAGAGGGELRVLRMRNLVLQGTDWLAGGGSTRLINAKGGETLEIVQMGAAKGRVHAPALVEWAKASSGALRGVQEQLQRLVG